MSRLRARIPLLSLALVVALAPATLDAAKKRSKAKDAAAADDSPLNAENLSGLAFRGIGPALMSGRIADIAIDPRDQSTWYVGVGSGGVWKTTNAGTTWTPIFDDQGSYSIGEITIDPSDPNTVWVGTGENVSGRHVGYGDGVYRSLDAGATGAGSGFEFESTVVGGNVPKEYIPGGAEGIRDVLREGNAGGVSLPRLQGHPDGRQASRGGLLGGGLRDRGQGGLPAVDSEGGRAASRADHEARRLHPGRQRGGT